VCTTASSAIPNQARAVTLCARLPGPSERTAFASSGRARMRFPVASKIAFARAGAIVMIGTSPRLPGA
jgi:hypothetical protein